MDEITQLIGTESAAKLKAAFGGTVITIPKKIHPEHRIAQVIGIEAASRLSRKFSGECVYIQKLFSIKDKHDQIIKARRSGLEYAELSKCFGLSTRQITNICKFIPKGAAQ